MVLIRSSGLVALAILLLFASVLHNDLQPEPTGDDRRFSSDRMAVSFRQVLKQLSFGQSSDTFGYVFDTLTANELLQQNSYTIVRHLDKEFSIGIEMEATSEQVRHLLNQIQIEGAAKYELTNMDVVPNRPVLRLTEMDPKVKVTLGDLPPIFIVKMEPLDYVLEYEDLPSQSPGLFVQPSEHDWRGTVAIVPDQHPNLVLRFNEEMDTSLLPQLTEGEWVDAYRYRLNLQKRDETMHKERISISGMLGEFRSLTGNYVGINSNAYSVFQVMQSDWLDMETESPVGWSVNDPFYETIVFSPDGESYVGTAVVGWPEGDANGSYFHIVLERKGQPPVTIEPYFYTNKFHQGTPVQWAGSNRVAYTDQESVFIYSLENSTRTTLFSTEGTNRFIHYVAYDPFSKQWNILTSTYDIQGTSEFGPFPIDLHLLNDSGKVISHKKEWSFAPLAIYWLMENPIIPAKNGVYRSFYRDGMAFTQFEHRDGFVTELPGTIQYADEQLAILLDNVLEDEVVEQILYLWRPGQKQPIAAAQAPGPIMIAGSMPISVFEGDYYKYHAAKDNWILWKSTQAIRLSGQTFRGMYKEMY